MPTQLTTTCSAFSAGVDEVTGTGQTTRFTFSGSWILNDKYTINMLFAATGVGERFGAGDLTGQFFSWLYTYREKMNVLAGNVWYFSEIGSSTKFNNPDGTGNGNIEVSNNFGISENLTCLCIYKSHMAVFSSQSVQIWQIGPSVEDYQQIQILQSIGTNAPLTVKGMGQLDLVFEGQGIHNVQAKEVTLDAGVIDIGTQVDQTVTDLIDAGAVESEGCGIVEPSAGRYWTFLEDRIFVLSYYPQSNISAWTTYLAKAAEVQGKRGTNFGLGGSFIQATVVGVQYYFQKGNATSLDNNGATVSASGVFTAASSFVTVSGPISTVYTGEISKLNAWNTFVPTKMVVYNNIVYLRGEDKKIYSYGGEDGRLYDATPATLEMPWLPDNTPMTFKQYLSMDVAMRGAWTITVGSDPTSGTLATAWTGGSATSPDTNVDSTFDALRIPLVIQGTHFKFKCVAANNMYKMARMSGLYLVYNQLNTD